MNACACTLTVRLPVQSIRLVKHHVAFLFYLFHRFFLFSFPKQRKKNPTERKFMEIYMHTLSTKKIVYNSCFRFNIFIKVIVQAKNVLVRKKIAPFSCDCFECCFIFALFGLYAVKSFAMDGLKAIIL